MEIAKLKYNYDTDKTTVILEKEFEELPKIHQLDAIQDAIFLLEKIYGQKLDEFRNLAVEGSKELLY